MHLSIYCISRPLLYKTKLKISNLVEASLPLTKLESASYLDCNAELVWLCLLKLPTLQRLVLIWTSVFCAAIKTGPKSRLFPKYWRDCVMRIKLKFKQTLWIVLKHSSMLLGSMPQSIVPLAIFTSTSQAKLKNANLMTMETTSTVAKRRRACLANRGHSCGSGL